MTQSKQTGTKLKGWLVRIVADGKVGQVVGSDLKYEDAGKDDSKLNAMKSAVPPAGK